LGGLIPRQSFHQDLGDYIQPGTDVTDGTLLLNEQCQKGDSLQLEIEVVFRL
jgi:hypothetical protein